MAYGDWKKELVEFCKLKQIRYYDNIKKNIYSSFGNARAGRIGWGIVTARLCVLFCSKKGRVSRPFAADNLKYELILDKLLYRIH